MDTSPQKPRRAAPLDAARDVLQVDSEALLAELRDSPQAPSGAALESNSFGCRSGAVVDDEEVADDPISLQKLVIDVKTDILLTLDDDAPTKSTGMGAGEPNATSLADEPTHECATHKKQRKERFLEQNAETGEWVCREGATCKSAVSESKRDRKHRMAAGNSMSYGEASNGSILSSGVAGGSKSLQAQTMFLCSVHRKMRSARNMAFSNGSWVCLPHMQCQLPTGDRLMHNGPLQPSPGDMIDRSSMSSSFQLLGSNSGSMSTAGRPPPPYLVPSMTPPLQQQQQQQPALQQQQQHVQPQQYMFAQQQPLPQQQPSQVVYVLPSGQTYLGPPPSSLASSPQMVQSSPTRMVQHQQHQQLHHSGMQPMEYSSGGGQQPQHQQQQVLYVVQQGNVSPPHQQGSLPPGATVFMNHPQGLQQQFQHHQQQQQGSAPQQQFMYTQPQQTMQRMMPSGGVGMVYEPQQQQQQQQQQQPQQQMMWLS